jgi:hypothetical protein
MTDMVAAAAAAAATTFFYLSCVDWKTLKCPERE